MHNDNLRWQRATKPLNGGPYLVFKYSCFAVSSQPVKQYLTTLASIRLAAETCRRKSFPISTRISREVVSAAQQFHHRPDENIQTASDRPSIDCYVAIRFWWSCRQGMLQTASSALRLSVDLSSPSGEYGECLRHVLRICWRRQL